MRGTREQLVWERFAVSVTTTAGSAGTASSLIASPAFLVPGVVDERWTLRGQRLTLNYTSFWSVALADLQPQVQCGVAMGTSVTNTAIPSGPTDEDWLDLWTVQYPETNAVQLRSAPLGVTNRSERTIRVQRKMGQEDALWFCCNMFYISPGVHVGFQTRINVGVSNLWQRTRR